MDGSLQHEIDDRRSESRQMIRQQQQPDENQSMTGTESLVQAEMIEEEPEREIPLAAAKPLVETDAQNCWARRRNRYIVVAVIGVVVIGVVVALVVAFLSGGSANETSTDSSTPPDWVQVGQVLVGEGAGDLSGNSVAISADGTVLAIGAPSNDRNGAGSGHVRVWQQTGGTWTRLGQDVEGMSSSDECGYSISLSADGTVLAIGEPSWSSSAGRVRVWRLVDSTWSQLGPSIEFEKITGRAGRSVSLSADGNVLAIGAPGITFNSIFSSAVSVWQWTLENWTQKGQYIDTESPDFFHLSVSLSANGTLLASGPFKGWDGYNSASYVRVWQWTEGNHWDPLGQDVYVENLSDEAGSSVALSSADGTAVLAIGAPGAGENGTLAGYVRVWRWMEGMTRGRPANSTHLGQDIEGKGEKDNFGRSLALSVDGKILAIGAAATDYYYASRTDTDASGYVRVFQWMDSEWLPLGSRLEGKGEYDLFGTSVALSADGKVLAVGAIQHDEESSRPGYVQVFQLQ